MSRIKAIKLEISIDVRIDDWPPIQGYAGGKAHIIYDNDKEETLNVSWNSGLQLDDEHELREEIQKILIDHDAKLEKALLSKFENITDLNITLGKN